MRTIGMMLGLAMTGLSTVAIAQQAPPPAAPAISRAASGPVPVEVFATLPTMDDPELSPDGTKLAARMGLRGQQVLVVTSIHVGSTPAIIGTRDKVDLNWWRWAGNDWLAVGVGAQNVLYGQDIYVTRLLGISADAKTINRIDWERSGVRADEVLWIADDGTPRLLLAKQTGVETMADLYPSVFDVDLSTGRTRRLLTGMTDVWNWYADGAGNVRMGVKYDDDTRRGSLLYRSDNHQSFRAIARSDARKDTDFVRPLVFRADGTALAMDDHSGRDALYEVSLPDLKLGRMVYGLDRYDLRGVMMNRAGNDISGVTFTDTAARVVWLDAEMKELQAAADAAVGAGRRARLISWSADRTRLLVAVGGPSQAGAIYYWDLRNGAMKHLGWQNEVLRARVLSPVSTIDYTARDGTRIEAVLTRPRSRPDAGNLPLIVMPHGGPFARDAEEWDWWSQYLAELGYVVIQPNYRGSSGYGNAFADLGQGQWGLKMQDDLNDAVTHLVKQGIVDPTRVCMAGASYGGYAAMRAAQRDGALYRCTISYAGVSDLSAMQRYDSRFLNGKTRADWLKKQAPDYRAVSPRFGAADFSAPILIVHGKEDRRVPVAQSRMMANALKQAGKPYDYIEQPQGDHHFTRAEDRLQFLKAMAAFLARYNPA